MNRRIGFTLIELLVVIAIIALLMAILMPTLNQVKKQARTAACQGQLKQWALSLRCTPTTTRAIYMIGLSGPIIQRCGRNSINHTMTIQ